MVAGAENRTPAPSLVGFVGRLGIELSVFFLTDRSEQVELGFEEGYIWLDGHLPGLQGYGPEMLIHARMSRDAEGRPRANPDETVREFRTARTANEELCEFVDAMAGRAPVRQGTSHQAFDAMNIAQRICAATETWA